MINLELILYIVWVKGHVHCSPYGYPIVPAPLIEKLPFHWNYLGLSLLKISWHVSMGLFLDSTLFYVCVSIIMPIPHHLDFCSFIICLKIRYCKSLKSVLYFFRKDCRILIGIALNININFGSFAVWAILSPWSRWTWIHGHSVFLFRLSVISLCNVL